MSFPATTTSCFWPAALSLLLFACASSAARLIEEPFDYPDGPLVGMTGSAWLHHSPATGGTGEVRIISGQAQLAFTNDEDILLTLPGQPYPAVPGTNLYAGFKVNFSVLPSGAGSYFSHFKDSGNVFRGRLWAFTDGAPAGLFRLGVSSASASSVNAANPTVLKLNTDFILVLKVATGTGATTLWINPTNESSLSITTTEGASGFNANAFALREASGMGVLRFDELRVGTAFADVFEPPVPELPLASSTRGFSLVTYNTHGNLVEDWSTNSPQVQAIGRQMQFLNPDIITFQEIPFTNTWQMGNFVAAFLPGYVLATNSGTDGFIRSAILSRFPITRSTKWLDGVTLTNFGYNGTFTRDLFEAQIALPGFPQPLHVFTTHLKAGQDGDNAARRGAEARAISNFFAIGFLATNALHPYLLTGDLNEDLARPSSGSIQPIQSLANPATGLSLTTPVNPQTGSELTFSSSAASFTRRYDYVLPSASLATNIAASEVFRSDLATNIAPALPGDSKAASDHLPVHFVFNNPFAARFQCATPVLSNGHLQLAWSSVPGGRYRVEATDSLTNWIVIATNLLAVGSQMTFSTNQILPMQFFRVRTEP